MPTYDYKCNACSHRFEQFQSMKDRPLKKCPECGKNALERLIGTGAAVIFKGSGFYQTDYRSEGYKKAADADKPVEASKSDTKAETKSEPKSESKAESKPAEKVAGNGSPHGKETRAAPASPASAKKKPREAPKD